MLAPQEGADERDAIGAGRLLVNHGAMQLPLALT
jgi:hypothetical protein